MDRAERYASLRLLSDDERKQFQLRPDFVAQSNAVPLQDIYRPWLRPDLDVVAETSNVEIEGYLANTLLRDSDAVSMANSLEIRPVLLDHPLVEFVFSLPAEMKINGSVNKPLLVEAVKDLLPYELVHRPKRGFELPLLQWMVSSLRDRVLPALESRAARSIFTTAYLDEAKSQIRSGKGASVQLWANFMLVEWMNEYGIEA